MSTERTHFLVDVFRPYRLGRTGTSAERGKSLWWCRCRPVGWLIAYIVSSILTIVLIGFVLLGVIWVVNIVFSVIAAIKANKGEWYTYPATIRFVS